MERNARKLHIVKGLEEIQDVHMSEEETQNETKRANAMDFFFCKDSCNDATSRNRKPPITRKFPILSSNICPGFQSPKGSLSSPTCTTVVPIHVELHVIGQVLPLISLLESNMKCSSSIVGNSMTLLTKCFMSHLKNSWGSCVKLQGLQLRASCCNMWGAAGLQSQVIFKGSASSTSNSLVMP